MDDVTELVRRWLHEKFPSLSEDTWKPTGRRVWISTDIDKEAFNAAVEAAFSQWFGAVQSLSLFEDVMAKTATRVRDQHEKASTSKTEQLKLEFVRPYRGKNAPIQLENFIVQCWRAFCEENEEHSLPYTTIVQSSGFGKSRLVSELAHRTKDTLGEDAHMRVLYTCVRDGESSNEFPRATTRLRDYFFPRRGSQVTLVERLCCLFDYAMSHWDTIGNDWIGLFTEQRVDESVHATISSFATSPQASERANNSAVSCHVQRKRRILVFAIDEASALLKTTEYNEHGWFRRLERALAMANKTISVTYGKFAGIFAILVDTTAAKSGSVLPSARLDDSSRGSDVERIPFPPFVLTHTMDIMFGSLIEKAQAHGSDILTFYQNQVHGESSELSLNVSSMGRPLWESCYERLGFDGVIQLAAEKLLGGLRPTNVKSFNKNTMHGVASLLCRVGIRPLSSSSLASRVVSDFMAVLSYVSTSTDQFISSYASEPVMAFGAARVWYRAAVHGDDHEILHQHILPELRKLLHQEAVDSRDSGELVARILLLLAMDTVGVLYTGTRAGRYYAGEFRSAWTFLSVLHGGNETVMDIFGQDVTIESSRELETLKTKWSGWQVGFSHFVQLTKEPDEACLWSMLARRAAGLSPHEFTGVNLIIPIFKGCEISMILVHVTNRPEGDPSFPSSASSSMRPKSVFTGEPFKRTTGTDVLRIYMSLCSRREPRRFFLVDPGESQHKSNAASQSTQLRDPELSSLVLCLEGLASWNVQTETHENVVFLSEHVAKALTALLGPWGQPMTLVQADLATPAKRFVDPMVTQTEAARPLVESLVEGKWPRVPTVSHVEASRSIQEIDAMDATEGTSIRGRKRKWRLRIIRSSHSQCE